MTAAAEAAFEQATYDAIIKMTFTRITECPPSRRSVDTLQKEVEHTMIKILCPHWDWAGRFGLLAEIKPAAEYSRITGGLVHVPVSEDLPDLISPWIRRGNSKQSRKRKTTKWSSYQIAWYTRRGGLGAISFNICEALPPAYYEQLKDALFGYSELLPRDYFDHLNTHWCTMDTKTIKKMTKGFYLAWNQVEHITKFAKRLDDEMTYLNTHDGIDITEANKLQFYTEQVLDSTYFDKSIIMKWEKRDPSRKTWAKATSYF